MTTRARALAASASIALLALVALVARGRRAVVSEPSAAASASASATAKLARPRAPRRARRGKTPEDEPAIGATFSGTVVRADDGSPVGGASVSDGDLGGLGATTDAQGRFRILIPHRGRFTPVAQAPGLYGRAPSLVIADGARDDILIRASAVASLRGRVEHASGEACAGTVELASEIVGRFAAAADASGAIVFPALPPGRYAARAGCGAQMDDLPAVEIGDADVTRTFPVRDLGEVRVTVTDEAGEPPADALSVDAHLETDASDGEHQAREPIDADGRARIVGLPPGVYAITAHAWTGRVDRAPATVTITPGSAPQDVTLVVSALHHLRGRVVTARGGPLPHAQLDVTQGGEGGDTELDADGGFDVSPLRAGPVDLVVRSGWTRLPFTSGDLHVTMPHAGLLTLVVDVPSPVEGDVVGAGRAFARVYLGCPGDQGDIGSADAAGHFVLPRHAPEAAGCVLSASTDDGAASAPIPPRDGPMTLTLLPPATLRGRIANAPRVFSVSAGGRAETFVDAGGAWALSGVRAGHVEVSARAAGLSADAEIDVAPGETQPVPLTLAPPTE